MAETQTAATLHLTKDQRQSRRSSLRGDNVDLAGYVGSVVSSAAAIKLCIRTGRQCPSCVRWFAIIK
jgi:hypothetical protein